MEYQTIKSEKVPSLGLGTWRLSGRSAQKPSSAPSLWATGT
jgi:diketogulonate reductase-like aldo/keto reductase